MSTKYPQNLDNDTTLPRVDDNITEVGGEAINGLRDAALSLERSVGTNPAGNKASLTERINVSLDSDGNLKTSALSAKGLVTLPINNAHIGSTAAILESKLDLDYSTASLKSDLNSLSATLSSSTSGLTTLSNTLNGHIYGLSNFHDGYDITLNGTGETQYGIAGFSSTSVGGVLTEIGTTLFGDGTRPPHIDLSLPTNIKHVATDVSIDASDFEVMDSTSANVQEALDSLDSAQGSFIAGHLDTFHSNGILREIKAGDTYNANQQLIDSWSATYTLGSSVVTIADVISFSALNVKVGDILTIETTGVVDPGPYQIRALGPLTAAQTLGDLPVLAANQLAVFHVFRATATVTTSIYRPESTSSENAQLACSVRHNETIVDTLTILNPNAARVVSTGFNSVIINGDGYDLCIEAGMGSGQIRNITITDLNRELLGTNQAAVVDARSVAERINAFVSDPTLGYHFPVSAFRIGNELALAHNLVGVEYTLKIVDGYTGNYALGLDSLGADVAGKTIKGNDSNSFVVGGVERSSIRTVLTAHVTLTPAAPPTNYTSFTLLDAAGATVNPLSYGIKAGSVMHVTGHPQVDANGSYTLLTSDATTVSTFVAEPITAPTNPTTFTITFTDSNVTLADIDGAESDQGIVQAVIDSSGKVGVHDRLTYGTSLGSGISIIDASETLAAGTYTLSVSTSGDLVGFYFIDSSALSGDSVSVHRNFTGTFRLYHSNNQDYIVIKVITTSGGLAGGLETIVVKEPVIYDESMVLCNAHFNGNHSITHVFDTRLMGNVGSDQIRDDFIEVYTQKPVDELRSDGVVRGFDILGLPLVDTETGMQALPLSGGVAYVGGVRVAIATQKVVVQSYNESGVLITNVDRIIGLNEFGSLQAFSDELPEILTDGYESSSEFGKILPLYKITLNSIGVISAYTDLRLFINKLDNKLDFTVDASGYNSIGSFKSIDGALEYVRNYPSLDKTLIRIVGSASSSVALAVPNGVSIIGSAPYGGYGKQRIINTGAQGDFITLAGNNLLENVEIYCADQTLYGSLVKIEGANTEVRKCLFGFGYTITTESNNWAIECTALDNVTIKDNVINNCFSGIVVTSGCANLIIEDNILHGVRGISASAYGIRVATGDRESNSTSILRNKIYVPSVVSPADISGISVNISYDVSSLRICDNDILHTAGNTLGYGIKVSNEGATSNTVKHAFIANNSINGVKLDDNNVWGIWVGDCENLIITNNSLSNIGITSNTSVGGIGITSGVLYAEITNNLITDVIGTRGIHINNSSAKVKITGNELVNLSDAAYYINGNAPYSTISDNKLIGPGDYGIVWTGTYSKIANNHLDKPGDGSGLTDYAFKTYAIYANTSDIDIEGNTILGMYYNGSIGISNVSTARTNARITNNTVSGTWMAQLIDLFGSGHIVSNNRLNCSAVATLPVAATIYISLTTVSNSLIMGNLIQGIGTYGISSGTSTTTGVSIVNNDFVPTNLTQCLDLYEATQTSTAQCLIMGNKMPYGRTGVSGEDAVGILPASGVYNTNTIGINAGMLDTRSVHACDFLTAYDANESVYGWRLRDGNAYWTPISPAVGTLTRYLYAPINDLPNGAQLVSVDLLGANESALGTWVAALYKFSNSGYAASLISAATAIPGADANFTFNIPTTSGAEVINYFESSYFLVVTLSGAITEGSNIVYGARFNFRY